MQNRATARVCSKPEIPPVPMRESRPRADTPCPRRSFPRDRPYSASCFPSKRTAGNRPFEKFLFGTDIHKKSAAIAEERHGLLRGQCFQHQKNRLLKSGATNGTQTKRASRKSAARTSAIPLPTAEGPPLFPASPPKHTPRNRASEPDAPPSLISGVRQTVSALWTAGPSARFPAVSPADFCR